MAEGLNLPTKELQQRIAAALELIAENYTPHTASGNGYFSRDVLPSVTKTAITIPAGMQVEINGKIYAVTTAVTLNASEAGSATERAGKDVYVYAVEPANGSAPSFVLSMNSTVPSGYTQDTSRKIGGFHCLCVATGATGNAAAGYSAGDIVPPSVWDLKHRPRSEPEGMVYIEELNLWCDIYLPSWSGSMVQSRYGGTILDGDSTPKMHGERFVEYAGAAKKRLCSRDEFMVIADSSTQMTNISGSTDPVTTGGHEDTASKRIVSKDFVEDLTGVLWQWTSDVFGAFNVVSSTSFSNQGGIAATAQTSSANGDHYLRNYQWQEDGRSTTHREVDGALNVKGLAYGALARALVGGDWGYGSHCGSRSVHLGSLSSSRYGVSSARLVSSPRAA